jgi:hypothetical protein
MSTYLHHEPRGVGSPSGMVASPSTPSGLPCLKVSQQERKGPVDRESRGPSVGNGEAPTQERHAMCTLA